MVKTTSGVRAATLLSVTALCLALVPTALAGKGGGAPPKGGSSSLALAMVADGNADGLPNWGDTVTFNVSTTATTQPYVSLKCYQGGTLVYSTSAGFYDGYAWPWTQNMALRSSSWTSGAADCDARLYSATNSGRTTTLATLSFHADA
jgi:hypothetical protein